MCLSKLYKTYKIPRNIFRSVTAYKVVYGHPESWTKRNIVCLRPPVMSQHEYKADQWHHSRTKIETDDKGRRYVAGFHCFKNRSDAESAQLLFSSTCVVVPVQLRMIVAEGQDMLRDTIVAKRLKIKAADYVAAMKAAQSRA